MEAPDRSSIKEANEHIRMLCARIAEQESTIREQKDIIIKKDMLHKEQISELFTGNKILRMELDARDNEIRRLNDSIKSLDIRFAKLNSVNREKDCTISKLENQSLILQNIAQYTPMFEDLVQILKSDPSLQLGVNMEKEFCTDVTHSSSSNHINGESPSGSSEKSSSVQQLNNQLQKSFNISANFSGSEDESEQYRGTKAVML